MFNILTNYMKFITIYHFYQKEWKLKKLEKLVPNAHHVESTSNRRGYYVNTSKTKFRRISTRHFRVRTFFDVTSMVEKSTLFPRTLFDLILMVKKSTLFSRTVIGVISMVEKSTLFSRTFITVNSMVEKSTSSPRTFFDLICLVKICTLLLLTFFVVILMGNNSTSFLVSCKLMKTLEDVFPVFVTLNSWLFQEDSLWTFQVNLPGVAQSHWDLSLTTSTIAKKTVASLFSLYLQNSYCTK